MLAPMSVVEGWAHYAEQMMIEGGFDRDRGIVHMGQLAESMVRLARLVVAIRLHAEDWSVEQGVRFFRETALVEEPSARREAERGTFDPGYGSYALGKMMLLKLRADVKAARGSRFNLKSFHDEVLGTGVLPLHLQRAALLGSNGGSSIE